MSAPLDLMGREIKVGDTIAYGLMVGRSANLAVYTVDKIVAEEHPEDSEQWDQAAHKWVKGAHTTFKLKATKVRQSYGGWNECQPDFVFKSTTLAMMERVLVVTESAKNWKGIK